jgi:hypothetical protein
MQLIALGQDRTQVLTLLVADRPGQPFDDHLGIANHRGQRRPQLMRHSRQKRRLDALGVFHPRHRLVESLALLL